MKIGCVILNYNDSETTINLVKKIIDYDIIDKIVIVDNKSTDGSVKNLANYITNKITLLISETNKGYSAGNNIGLKYLSSLDINYVIIANPDIEFEEDHVIIATNLMETNLDVAITSFYSVNTKGEKAFQPAWKSNSLFIELISSSKVLRRFFLRKINYSDKEINSDIHLTVDVLPGSFLIVRFDYFREIDFFDENVFLYCEERILSSKLKSKSYESILITNKFYIHNHSTSINKSIKSYYKREFIWLKSRFYYLVNYKNKYSYLNVLIFIFFIFLNFELVIVAITKKLTNIKR